MKHFLFYTALLNCLCQVLSGQNLLPDTSKTINLNEIIIMANKLPVLLKNNPGPVSLVSPFMLSTIPKTIGAEEALRLVPGVRVDNQHDGERVHLSIRGQGILTERGLRGIGVFIDGIPVNDPSGFAPDLYDVEWATVRKMEVLRGPAAGLYGGSSSGGVLNIFTGNGGSKPIGGEIRQMFGSHGFVKSLVQLDGSKDLIDYRVTYSRNGGDGYRDHQAFRSNKLFEKINFHPSDKLSVSQIISHTEYFQQNPEGLNLGQLDNPLQANPDANPFNEYQKTNRTTIGLHGTYKFNETHDIEAVSYLRAWNYKETSNRCAEYRTITNPGANFQYNLHLNSGKVKNDISIGTDFKSQHINMVKLQSASNPLRVESIDETNIETDSLMANQIIAQQNLGVFALYKMELNKFTLVGNLRYDKLDNRLTNKIIAGEPAIISKDFSETSLRVGGSYSFSDAITLFTNWSQGFIPPSTEELASNPTGYSGFNTHLVPATSNCMDLGIRGVYVKKIYYEITGFLMNTENDFFRFKQTGRGNQEVFYGNAGNSRRVGIETFLSWMILKNLSFQAAYTFAGYTYTSAAVDPVYTEPKYVLTTPPAEGQWLPNSPKHQLFAEIEYAITRNLKISFSSEYQSKWAIYTDAKAYKGDLDPTVYQNWQSGFNLFHTRVSYQWTTFGLPVECSISGRNLTAVKYMAFTEPDPDGNSYQPGPGREIFGSIKIRF
jgi:iron complex outermembrane recepter protein